MSETLPKPEKPFGGKIGVTTSRSQPEKPSIQSPPKGAPNVVIVLLDDVGFGASATFGGPVPTPTLDLLAKQGLRYNQFHTTALCSPTRAALLTGRNHHSVGMGAICEIGTGYPGYSSVIPRSAATVAEVLRLNGYNTAMFGKNHLTPMWETSPAGPFDRWPTGLGFERFYGFLGGEASQFEPALFDQTTPVEAHVGKENYHLTEDLADQCIKWLRTQKTSAPDKPFFVYFPAGACHSPLQAPPEWIEKFRGQFDQGWDKLREETYARQIKSGVIPAGTQLTPRPEAIPSWDEYPDRYKPVASRLMEVWAAFLAHADAQIGRMVDAIQDLGVWDNTLFFYIVGDNGTSGEGTLHGAWSCPAYQNGVPEDPEWLLAHIDDFGTARCENHFNVGWAWALDAPFQWMKQIASHFGGTRNGMVVSWPEKIHDRGGLRSQFHHVIDIMPTILEAAHLPQPGVVNGTPQKPIEGVSMVYSFDNAKAPARIRPNTSKCSAIAVFITKVGSPAASTDACRGSAPRPCPSTAPTRSGSSTTSPWISVKARIWPPHIRKNWVTCGLSSIRNAANTTCIRWMTTPPCAPCRRTVRVWWRGRRASRTTATTCVCRNSRW